MIQSSGWSAAVAAPGVWPQTNALTGHARVVRCFLTITTGPLAARNLFVRAEHRRLTIREEGSRGTRIGAQLEMHRHIIFVEWIGDRLAAELAVGGRSTQIINLDDDAVPEWSRGRGRVGVRGGRYLKAASATAASTTVGTVCERVDSSRVPIHLLAARCREDVALSELQGVM